VDVTKDTQPANRSGQGDDARTSFSADLRARSIGNAIREYFDRIRGGDPGALPSVLGLVVLGVIFYTTADGFLSKGNVGTNIPSQGAYIAIIALGLVFVLLVGEIDLSAGTTGGLCAAFAGQALQSQDLHAGLGTTVYVALIVGLLAAIALGIYSRMIVAPAIVSLGLLLMLFGVEENHQFIAFFFAVSIGVAIGIFIGTLVARLGIPSFVVTLALFLAWEGVELYALNNQNISTVNYSDWYGLTHYSMAVWAGWTLFVVLAGGYLVATVLRAQLRARADMSHDAMVLVLVRAGIIVAVGAGVTYFLNQPRNGDQGVPWAAAAPIVFMVFWTIVLSKSQWGRHLYAIGGNEEAARRAGIHVARVKINAFAICSGMAAIGGLFLADQTGGAETGLGQGDVLLFAVAAAVIGGTSLFGGRGKPRDAIVGALVITTIPNGIQLLHKPVDLNEVITGLVLLIAAAVDAVARRRSRTR
jgi:D-xylose transport system permease protein